MEPDADTLDICLPFAVFGPGDFRPQWRSEVVVGLATGILEDGAFERLPILADALEEAGCTDEALLRHCRDPIQHDAQCWALGLALNRYIPPEPEPTPPPSVVEPPRPVAPTPRPGRTTDDVTRPLWCFVFVVWLVLKATQCPGGSSKPPTPTIYPPDRPPPLRFDPKPAAEPPRPWSLPPDPKWSDLYDARPGEARVTPSDFRPAPPWWLPQVPARGKQD